MGHREHASPWLKSYDEPPLVATGVHFCFWECLERCMLSNFVVILQLYECNHACSVCISL